MESKDDINFDLHLLPIPIPNGILIEHYDFHFYWEQLINTKETYNDECVEHYFRTMDNLKNLEQLIMQIKEKFNF